MSEKIFLDYGNGNIIFIPRGLKKKFRKRLSFFKSNKKNVVNISFCGAKNLLYIDDGVDLNKCIFNFKGNNSLIYISKSFSPLKLDLTTYNDSTIFLGENSSMLNVVQVIASEKKNVIIGNEVMFSTGVIIRTSDAHAIYSITDNKRLNDAKSTFIGDHCWIGPRVVLLKGCKLYSGSIIGSDSVVSGKIIASNTIWAGNPARLIKNGVFFDKRGTHGLDDNNFSSIEIPNKDIRNKYIFEFKREEFLDYLDIDKALSGVSVKQKMEWIKLNLNHNSKNRFSK